MELLGNGPRQHRAISELASLVESLPAMDALVVYTLNSMCLTALVRQSA
jgi:hypothetical protein